MSRQDTPGWFAITLWRESNRIKCKFFFSRSSNQTQAVGPVLTEMVWWQRRFVSHFHACISCGWHDDDDDEETRRRDRKCSFHSYVRNWRWNSKIMSRKNMVKFLFSSKPLCHYLTRFTFQRSRHFASHVVKHLHGKNVLRQTPFSSRQEAHSNRPWPSNNDLCIHRRSFI